MLAVCTPFRPVCRHTRGRLRKPGNHEVDATVDRHAAHDLRCTGFHGGVGAPHEGQA